MFFAFLLLDFRQYCIRDLCNVFVCEWSNSWNDGLLTCIT